MITNSENKKLAAFPPPHFKVWVKPLFLRKCIYNQQLLVKTKNYQKIATKKGYAFPHSISFQELIIF